MQSITFFYFFAIKTHNSLKKARKLNHQQLTFSYFKEVIHKRGTIVFLHFVIIFKIYHYICMEFMKGKRA